MCQKNTRLIICVSCRDFIQMPNPEQGECKILEHAVNYDNRCLLGLYEHVKCPDPHDFETEIIIND